MDCKELAKKIKPCPVCGEKPLLAKFTWDDVFWMKHEHYLSDYKSPYFSNIEDTLDFWGWITTAPKFKGMPIFVYAFKSEHQEAIVFKDGVLYRARLNDYHQNWGKFRTHIENNDNWFKEDFPERHGVRVLSYKNWIKTLKLEER